MRIVPFALVLGLFLAAPAVAQTARQTDKAEEEEALCADRPGLASTTCTVEPGRVQVELAIDWSFQEDGDARTDTILAGDTVVRVGLDEQTELQAGLTAFGHVRERTPAGVTRAHGVGDAFIGLRRGLYESNGTTIAVQGRVSLPIGGDAIGAGDWGAELYLPVGITIAGNELLLTPTIAAAPDADRDGRHLAYGFAAGYSFNLSERLSTVLDLAAYRDEDPTGHSTELLAGVALAWELHKNLQLDLGAVIGLNDDAADLEIYVGAASRF